MTSDSGLNEPAIGGELLRLLQTCMSNRKLYPPQHPQVRQPAREFIAALAEAREEESDVTLGLLDGELYLNGIPLREASVQYDAFLRKLDELHLQILHFAPGITLEEIGALVDALVHPPQDLEEQGGLAEVLGRAGARHITCERLLRLPDGRYELLQRNIDGGEEGPGAGEADGYGAGGKGGAGGDGEEGTGAGGDDDSGAGGKVWGGLLETPVGEQRSYAGAVGDTQSLFTSVATGGGLEARLTQALPQHIVTQCLSEPGAFLNLLHMRSMGSGMFQHGVNTAVLSVLLATKLELEEEQLRHIALGALLHDVGELQTPDELRDKPGALTEAEWAIVQRHPLDGAKLVLGLPDLQPAVASVVLEHHRRFDGGGYPALSTTDVPHLYARIAAVADAYDALTHPKSYQARGPVLMPVEELLQEAGASFDPTIVKLLLHTVGFYPPGTPVLLSDGRSAIVESPSPGQPFLPRVIVSEEDTFTLVDLAQMDGAREPLVTITRVDALPETPAPIAEMEIDATGLEIIAGSAPDAA